MKNAKVFAFLSAAVVVMAACADRRTSPTSPNEVQALPRAMAGVMGTCTTIGQLNTLAQAIFSGSGPNVNSVLGKLDNLRKKVEANNVADAQAQAQNIVSFVQMKASEGQLGGTQAQITQFISGVLCFAGLSPNTFLILPSDAAQTRIADDGLSGIQLPANPVGVPTLLTMTTLDPNGPSPLITLLDQYPAYVDFTTSSPIVGTAIVAVCPAVTVPPAVRARLRLGHQASSGFQITPAADGSFLTCGSASLAQSKMPGWLRNIASLILPKPLYATKLESGGVGGSVTELSPFDAVDPELSFRGGVGGSVTELLREGEPDAGTRRRGGPPSIRDAMAGVTKTPGAVANTVVGGVCTASAATVGTGLEPECRPTVELKTFKGTILKNVPISWAVTGGGGTIAASDLATNACGAFGSTAANTTNTNGKAAICWTLGPLGGPNTSRATPSAGGDAPAGVSFNPAQLNFTADGLKITPTAGATGGNFVFDAAPHAGAGTCSDGLTPALTYTGGGVPQNAGSYTLTVTCGAGSLVYNTVTATATITITPATPVVAVSCPDSVVYSGAAQTPCSATATGPGLSASAAVTYANNVNVGTATATGAFEADGNYVAATGTATFQIVKAGSVTTVTCGASPTYTGSAHTPCSATATGVGGLSQSVAVTYTDNVNAGIASASATFAGGANHHGSTGSANFTILAAATSVAVSCPASVAYNAAVQTPCSASVSGPGLASPLSVSYAPASPRNAGSYTASAAFAAGGNYLGSANATLFAIVKAAATATSGSATMNFGATVPAIPCTVSGLLAGDAGAVTCTSSVPAITAAGTYPTTPVISPASPANYNVASVSGTLTVAAYVKVGCLASPVYSVMPESKSAQKKGSNLPIKCTLQTPQGAAVTNATGNVQVIDAGTAAVVPPVKTGIVVFSATNAMKYSNSGNYSYGLDTSPAAFVVGHYYYVVVTWNDGSKTEGWFLLK
jgi:hypothetical protein